MEQNTILDMESIETEAHFSVKIEAECSVNCDFFLQLCVKRHAV